MAEVAEFEAWLDKPRHGDGAPWRVVSEDTHSEGTQWRRRPERGKGCGGPVGLSRFRLSLIRLPGDREEQRAPGGVCVRSAFRREVLVMPQIVGHGQVRPLAEFPTRRPKAGSGFDSSVFVA